MRGSGPAGPIPAMTRQRFRYWPKSAAWSWLCGVLDVRGRLDVQEVKAALLQRHEIRHGGAGARARTRQRDRNGGNDASRPRAHDVHLVGQKDRFLDVMGDEHDGFAEILP